MIRLFISLSLATVLLNGCRVPESARPVSTTTTGVPVAAVPHTVSTGEANAAAIVWVLYLDLSGSIPTEQLNHWFAAAKALSLRIQPGDRAIVRPLHNNTANDGAIFNKDAPLLPKIGLAEKIKVKRQMDEFRQNLVRAVEGAFADQEKAKVTDVFSAFSRLHDLNDVRAVRLVFFSDGLHSKDAGDLNFEKTTLQSGRLGKVIEQAAAKYGLHQSSLKNTKVSFVLPAIGMRHQQMQDRKLLRSFYESLISACGGKLICFETDCDFTTRL